MMSGMTHLPHVLASYALGLAMPLGFGIAAWLRLRAATRRLAAAEPRRGRASSEPRRGREAGT
jgi:hypothetical protein